MEEKWHPRKGDTYWYVSVRYCCNFTEVKVIEKTYNGKLNYYPESNNYFNSLEKAIEAANKIRRIFNQPLLKIKPEH